MSLRGLGALTRAYLIQSFRSRTAVFWNLLFPLLWLFVYGYVLAQGDPEKANLLMPGLFTITIISSSFFGVSYLMVSERESEILRRYRVTPVTTFTVVLANVLRAMVTMGVSLVVQVTCAKVLFGLHIAGSWLDLAVVMLLGGLAFVPLGLIVGSVAQDMKSAPAISNLIFFPMMFLSGAAMPSFMLPEWVQKVGRLLPATYLVDALQGVIVRGERIPRMASTLLVLVLSAAVGASLNKMLFRWESDDPVDKRALTVALVGLAVLFAAAALLAPELRMNVRPGG